MSNRNSSSRLDHNDHKAALLLMGSVVLAGCIGVGIQERRLIVLNEGALEHRIKVARDFTTNEQLKLLRASVTKRFPEMRETDAMGLRLTWERLITGREEVVAVVVTFTPPRHDIDAKAIADYTASQVRAELRSKL
jgi:hypothetical protein